MSNNLNQSKTLREYYIKFTEIRDPYVGNEWGWFVDLDFKGLPKSRPIQNYKSSLTPINEYPSIRSIKSITNLQQMENNKIGNQIDNIDKINFYKYSNFICINLIGIITFTMIYYIID